MLNAGTKATQEVSLQMLNKEQYAEHCSFGQLRIYDAAIIGLISRLKSIGLCL